MSFELSIPSDLAGKWELRSGAGQRCPCFSLRFGAVLHQSPSISGGSVESGSEWMGLLYPPMMEIIEAEQ